MLDSLNNSLAALPDWSKEFIQDLQEKFSVLNCEIAMRNFPNNRFPRWMQTADPGNANNMPKWVDSFFWNADRDLQELWLQLGFLRDDPLWLSKLLDRETARVSRLFLLTGNINDYVFDPDEGYMSVMDLLEKNAATRKDWVIRYSLSSRFTAKQGKSRAAEASNPIEKLGLPDTATEGQKESSTNLLEMLRMDFRAMETVLRQSYNDGVCLILENFHMLLPPDTRDIERNVLADALLRWAQAPWMFQSRNIVVLLAESAEALNSEMRSRGSQIDSLDIPRPDSQDERLKFLISVFSGPRVIPMTKIRLDNATRPRFDGEAGESVGSQLIRFADRTSGLNLVGLENIILHVNIMEERTLTNRFIKDKKRELLIQESAGLLTVTEPEDEPDRSQIFKDVGGLDKICQRLIQISQALDKKGESEVIRHAIPKGLLFLGPPGTGKTLVARSFATACGINFAELGDFRDMWVGQSERNLSRVLGLIRSLRPVIVFMDEIDQSEGSRGSEGDSGVGRRIFSKLLQFMSDPSLEGDVIWIGASNRPDLIDAALKRAGRFDMVIPFFLPEAVARRRIFEIQIGRRGASTSMSPEEWKQTEELSDGFTGAEIEALVKEAIWRIIPRASNTDSVSLNFDDLKNAFEVYRPPANREQYEEMIRLAVRDVTFIDMLPDKYRKMREEMHQTSGHIDRE